MIKNLAGKNIMISGATSGIGLAAALCLVRAGSFVIGIGRSEARIRSAEALFNREAPSGKFEFVLADLAVQSEVKKAVKLAIHILNERQFDHLDVLINNAGVYLEKKQRTDGIEKTFAVNHLSYFMLAYHLLPKLIKSRNGRIINMSSYAHFTTPLNLKRIVDPWPYFSLLAYKRSKLCNVLFTYELNRRESQVTAFAVDPGLVNTGIGSKGGTGIANWVWQRRRKKGVPTEKSTNTILHLAGEERINTDRGFYFKNCQPVRPSHQAQREDLSAALWALSCQLTGINW